MEQTLYHCVLFILWNFSIIKPTFFTNCMDHMGIYFIFDHYNSWDWKPETHTRGQIVHGISDAILCKMLYYSSWQCMEVGEHIDLVVNLWYFMTNITYIWHLNAVEIPYQSHVITGEMLYQVTCNSRGNSILGHVYEQREISY